MADKIPTKKGSNKINPKNFVKIGRLKEIRDSLMNEAENKMNKQWDLIHQDNYPNNKSVIDKVNYLDSSTNNDLKYANKYHKIIGKKLK